MARISRLALRRPLRTPLLVASLAAGTALAIGSSTASGRPITSTGAVPARANNVFAGSFTGGIDSRGVTVQGETFFKATIYKVFYFGGPVILSGSSDGTADTLVDDVLILKIVHSDLTKASFTHDYSSGCTAFAPLAPKDIQSKLQNGANQVTVTLKDKCGVNVSSSALWLTGS